MTDKSIRSTRIYMPRGKPLKPCPVAFRRGDPRCRLSPIDMRQPFARPLALLDVNAAGGDALQGDYLAGTDHADDHLLYMVIEGQCWGISQKFRKRIGAGELFIAAAGHGAWIQLTEGTCKAVWFHLADTPAWQILKSDPVTVHQALDPMCIPAVMELLLREQAATQPDRESVLRHYCAILAAALRRELRDVESPAEREARNRLHRLRALLNERLEEEWTVARMAAVLNVSAGHLHLLTKRHRNQTPLDILRELRMDRARSLLQSTHLTLDNIATQVGYRSAYAFSDAFRRHTGIRPGAYRG
ncbi:MAG: helix-turn-helix transcriptional regulator [Verrucomicrobia bacterium]|nr:helix-turn-helix transcriptional regulator [Verrucomicrobiota bacterium]